MKVIIGLAMLFAAAAWADDAVVKVFSDKGSMFVKADKNHPLVVGTELTMVSDAKGTKTAGTGMVMEVTGMLARITLDDEATKAAAKFAKLPAGDAKATAPAPESAAPKVAPIDPKLPALNGHLENGLLRVSVSNGSDNNWSECELRFNDGRYYKLGELAPHADDTVVTLKFSKPPSPPEPLYDHVLVVCDEGQTKFMFNDPHSPGQLKGYAENAGSGRVVMHNSGDTMWTRCDVRKPDKTHYIMERLKPKENESIRSGVFIKEKENEPPPATVLALVCKQGQMAIDLTH